MLNFRITIAAAFLAASSPLLACTYPIPTSFHRSFTESKHIFIFRLESLALTNRVADTVTGRIKVLRTLRGKAPRFEHIRFSVSHCGGNRLDVGHYFLAMTSQDGNMLVLESASRSVIDLRWQYSEDIPDALNDRQYFLASIHRFLKGKQMPQDFPSMEELQFTQYTAPPPNFGER